MDKACKNNELDPGFKVYFLMSRMKDCRILIDWDTMRIHITDDSGDSLSIG